MTYLELVNKVMRRMREPQVGSVSENSYSLLIAELVNDAKRVVESAWAWRALIDSVPVVTSPGTSTYDLQDFNCVASGIPANEDARIYMDPKYGVPLILVGTTGQETLLNLQSLPFDAVARQQQANNSNTSKPTDMLIKGNPNVAAGNTNMRVEFSPIPDGIYTINVFIVNPQNDLVDDEEVLLVPSFPVIQLAYLYGLYERGEEIGEALTLTSEKATAALADAIAYDSSETSDLIFSPD